MQAFLLEQWFILLLAFLLGLFLGMAFLANPKWKRRYREEARLHGEERSRREALEAERTHWEAQTIAQRARDDAPVATAPGTTAPVTSSVRSSDAPVADRPIRDRSRDI